MIWEFAINHKVSYRFRPYNKIDNLDKSIKIHFMVNVVVT